MTPGCQPRPTDSAPRRRARGSRRAADAGGRPRPVPCAKAGAGALPTSLLALRRALAKARSTSTTTTDRRRHPRRHGDRFRPRVRRCTPSAERNARCVGQTAVAEAHVVLPRARGSSTLFDEWISRATYRRNSVSERCRDRRFTSRQSSRIAWVAADLRSGGGAGDASPRAELAARRPLPVHNWGWWFPLPSMPSKRRTSGAERAPPEAQRRPIHRAAEGHRAREVLRHARPHPEAPAARCRRSRR